MRVTLVQIRLISDSRSANLQHVLSAIDRAADAVPAPDVVVLPGSCDTGGASVDLTTPAQRTCIQESIASKAREWGIFVAVGLHTRGNGVVLPMAVLFDPDGDIVSASICGPGDATGNMGQKTPQMHLSPAGWIGVFKPGYLPGTTWTDMPTSFLLAMPLALSESVGSKPETWLPGSDELVRDVSLRYMAIVRPAYSLENGSVEPADRRASVLLDGRGTVVCSVSGTDEDFVSADVAVNLPAVDDQAPGRNGRWTG